VLVAQSKESLQHKIDIAARFFRKRGLRVNLDKTKVVVFKRRGRTASSDQFTWAGAKVEVVNTYCYLGVNLRSTGNFHDTAEEFLRKGLSAQGAVFNATRAARTFDINLANKLFDSTIKSTALYSAGIWGQGQEERLEILQQAYYKRVLSLPRNTPRYFVRLETGRKHIKVEVLKAVLALWSSILKSKTNSLLYNAYYALRAGLSINQSPDAPPTWCSHLRKTLTDLGFQHVWEANSSNVLDLFLTERIETCGARLRSSDLERMAKSSSIPHYPLIKASHNLAEPYLKNSLLTNYAKTIAQLRLGYNVLCVKNKWLKLGEITGTPCNLCGDTESLSHIILECPGRANERLKWIPEIASGQTSLWEAVSGQSAIQSAKNFYIFLAQGLRNHP